MKSSITDPLSRSTISVHRFLVAALLLFCWLNSARAIPQAYDGVRFNFFNDFGCALSPGGAGALDSGVSDDGGNNAFCAICQQATGMPRWWVDEPYISMHVVDEPLSYTLSSGQQMAFKIYYKQNFTIPAPDQVPTFYNTFTYGPRTGDGITVTPYLNASRGYGGTTGYYGGMTNAAWMHSWQEYIVLWDYSWEAAYNSYYTLHQGLPPTKAFSDSYEAMAFMPSGGVYYFTSNATNETLNPATQLRNGVSQVQLSSFPLSHPTPTNTPVADSHGIYWGSGNTNGLVLSYPDGSQDVFGLTWWSGASEGGLSTAAALLTQKIDPQGRVTQLGYVRISVTNACSSGSQTMYALTNVVDPDGRTNRFFYNTQSPGGGLELAQIEDPFGRTATFNYLACQNFSYYPANPGWLTSIVDSQGISNAFKYGASYFGMSPGGDLSDVITPYGTDSFSYKSVPNSTVPTNFDVRATYVTEPDGAKQLFGYFNNATNLVPDTLASPGSIPDGWIFDDGTTGDVADPLCYRNSFYWGRAQMANVTDSTVLNFLPGNPAAAITAMSTNDLNKGRLQHWLLDQDEVSITQTLSSEQDPSPDNGGNIPGERTWYAYTNVTGAADYMTTSQVRAVAQILPDNTSKYTLLHYYPSGLVATNTSSFTQPDGTVGTFVQRFIYSNGNNIDLTLVSNSVGQSNVITYDGNHHWITITDSVGRVTIAGWDGTSQNLVGLAYPNGQTLALSYYPATTAGHIYSSNSYISNVTVSPQNLSDTFVAYTNSVPQLVHRVGTGLPDLWSTNTVDGLNRLTGTVFQDGTSLSNIYKNLDLVGQKDRLGDWTYYAYDGLQHLTNVTDALSNMTAFTWCSCGSLTSISNMLTYVTLLNYDNQSRLTNVEYPDLSSKNWQYDLLGRLTNVYDGAGNSQQFGYNNQDQVSFIGNAYGQIFGGYYDAVGRATSVTNANGVVMNNSFDLVNRLKYTTWMNGSSVSYGWATNGLIAFTNQNSQWTLYGRDNAGRLTAVTNAVQKNYFGYNALDELTSLTDGVGNNTTWGFNQFGWMTSKINTRGVTVLTNGYDLDGRITTRWMMGTNTTYQYDAVGNLTKIIYPATNVVFKYDAVHELTNMADSSGVTSWTWTQTGQLASETAPWTSSTINLGYTQGHRTNLSLSQPSGTWNEIYTYDGAWRLYNLTSPVGTFGFSYPSGINQYLVNGITLPNVATITNGYDGLSRLINTALVDHWGHTLDGYSYGLDLMGQRTNISRQLGLPVNNVSVSYDPISEITGWIGRETNSTGTLRENEQLSYGYDAAGNLHSRTNNALVQTFVVDSLNQLSNVTRTGTLTVSGSLPEPPGSVTVNGTNAQTNSDFTFAASGNTLISGANTFTVVADDHYGSNITTSVVSVNLPATVNIQYDANGNLISDGTRTFQYDAENQLTNVYATNAWRVGFVYDGLKRKRVEIDSTWSSGWVPTNGTEFIYDGNLVIQERTTNNAVTVTYTRGFDMSGGLQGGGGIGGLLARTDVNGSLFYHSDGSGNITALMDGNQRITARYEYDPYGRLLGMWGTNAPANRYRFSSKEFISAAQLYAYGCRFYEPNFSRWLNRDPIGENGGINLYGFVGNNPVNLVDINGLWGFGPFWFGSTATYMTANGTAGYGTPPSEQAPASPYTYAAMKAEMGVGVTGLTDANGNPVSARDATTQIGMAVPNGFLQAAMMLPLGPEEAAAKAAEEAAAAKAAAEAAAAAAKAKKCEKIADAISKGHAYAKHVLKEGQFNGATTGEFADMIQYTMENPSATRALSNGRTAYYDANSGLVVIVNPNAADMGTAFVPANPLQYFNGLK